MSTPTSSLTQGEQTASSLQNHTTRRLNRSDYKTLALSSLGGTLEFYDFVIYMFFTEAINQLFFPGTKDPMLATLQSMGIFAAGYFARPFGGLLIAHFGDKFGRKRMFSLSIFLMAAPTLCIGLIPSYDAIGVAAPLLLLLMRILQGIAIGGEMPGGWVFVAEHVPAKHYGLGLGILTSGIAGGILLGCVVAILVENAYPAQSKLAFAWRIPFILGGIFGLISVYLRRFLSETPLFKEIASKNNGKKELPVLTVIKKHLPACGLTALMTWSLAVTVVVSILMTPTFLQQAHHISKANALQANCIATLVFVFGNILFGWMSDRFGSRLTMIICWGGFAISAYLFYSNLPNISQTELIIRYAILGLFAGSTVTMPIVSVRAFPTEIRFSGLSFAYNMSYAIVGGITPILTQLWLSKDTMAPAHYIIFVSVMALLLGCTSLARFGVDAHLRGHKTPFVTA